MPAGDAVKLSPATGFGTPQRGRTLFAEKAEGRLNAMHRLFWISAFTCSLTRAQSVQDARELLRKVQSIAESTRTWRAEVIETSQLSGGGMNLKQEVRTKIAVQAPLKMRRENSGDDQTILVC